MEPTENLLQAIAVTAELTSTPLSTVAARIMAQDLARYPEAQILAALTRCRRELKGRLTIADVLTRIDDGRPGVEEAWAMIPKSEAQSVVWTEEMAHAFGVSENIKGDPVAARMAFKETYLAAVQKARDASTPVKWTPTLGHDRQGREAALIEAQNKCRMLPEHVRLLLPYMDAPAADLKALGFDAKSKKVAAG